MKIKFYFLSPFALSNWMTHYWDRITVSLYNSEKVELCSWSGFADNNVVGMIMLLTISHSSILISSPVCSFLCTSFWEDPKVFSIFFSIFLCLIMITFLVMYQRLHQLQVELIWHTYPHYIFLVPLASLFFLSSFKWHLFHIN